MRDAPSSARYLLDAGGEAGDAGDAGEVLWGEALSPDVASRGGSEERLAESTSA